MSWWSRAIRARAERAALALALASCAGPPRPAPAADVVLEAPIAPLPMPVVTLGGVKALLDTGATAHAVRRAGPAAHARVLDAHGAPLGAERLSTAPIAGVPGPWFGVEGLPLAVVIAPRAMLAAGQSAEIDLRAGRFAVHDDPRTGAALVARSAARAEPTACANGALFAVRARLAGKDARMLVDTGSAKTTLLLRSPLAPAFRGWSNYPAKIPDPSGEHDAWVVLAVPLDVAGLEQPIDLVVADDPAEPCDVDGALGMDVLGRCAIVLMRGAAGLACD